jgi:hypothetical protein
VPVLPVRLGPVPTPQVDEVSRIPHGEAVDGQIEVLDQPNDLLLGVEQAHPAEFRPQMWSARWRDGQQAAPDALAQFTERNPSARIVFEQTPGDVRAGDAAADHHDVIARIVRRALPRDREPSLGGSPSDSPECGGEATSSANLEQVASSEAIPRGPVHDLILHLMLPVDLFCCQTRSVLYGVGPTSCSMMR